MVRPDGDRGLPGTREPERLVRGAVEGFTYRKDLNIRTDLPMVLESGPEAALMELEAKYPAYDGMITVDVDEACLPAQLKALQGKVTSDGEFASAVGAWMKQMLRTYPDYEICSVMARVSGSGRGIHVAFRCRTPITGGEVMVLRQLFGDDRKRWNLDLDRARQNVHYLGGNLWNRKGPNQEEQRGNRKVHPTKLAGEWISVVVL